MDYTYVFDERGVFDERDWVRAKLLDKRKKKNVSKIKAVQDATAGLIGRVLTEDQGAVKPSCTLFYDRVGHIGSDIITLQRNGQFLFFGNVEIGDINGKQNIISIVVHTRLITITMAMLNFVGMNFEIELLKAVLHPHWQERV